jgi:hypothetical protein
VLLIKVFKIKKNIGGKMEKLLTTTGIIIGGLLFIFSFIKDQKIKKVKRGYRKKKKINDLITITALIIFVISSLYRLS